MPEIFFFLTSAPIGYTIGRVGHIFGGHFKTLHHWIYGFLLIIFGGIATHYQSYLGAPALLFGVGLFISDLRDFLDFKFYGVDEPGPKSFWGID